MLAYRTENANRIKRKEKRKMDVINILINPSEKAKCGHGAVLTTVPPGAAAGSGLGSTRRLDGGGPGPPGAPRGCGITAVRLAKSDFKFHMSSCIVFLVRHRLLREFDGVLYGISRLKL